MSLITIRGKYLFFLSILGKYTQLFESRKCNFFFLEFSVIPLRKDYVLSMVSPIIVLNLELSGYKLRKRWMLIP